MESPPTPKPAEKEEGFKFNFHDIIGDLGIVLGLVGALAWIDARNTARKQESVFGYIRKNMAKEVTEETLAKLQEQMRQMERQTKEELPKLARRAVLEEQSLRLKDLLAETYMQWKRIEDELGFAPAGALAPEIEKAITDRMKPAYLAKMKMEAAQQRLAIGGAAIALCSFVLPRPLDDIAGVFLALWLVPTVLEMVSAGEMTERKRKNIQWAFRGIYALLILGLFFFGYLVNRERYDVNQIERMLGNVDVTGVHHASFTHCRSRPRTHQAAACRD